MTAENKVLGRIELNEKDAARLIVHMNEDKPNPKAKINLQNGKQLRAQMRDWAANHRS